MNLYNANDYHLQNIILIRQTIVKKKQLVRCFKGHLLCPFLQDVILVLSVPRMYLWSYNLMLVIVFQAMDDNDIALITLIGSIPSILLKEEASFDQAIIEVEH